MGTQLLSDRVRNLSESATLKMTRRSRELREQGYDVINLSIGEPDFNTPECVKEAGKTAIDNNFSHYTPVAGIPELRQVVTDKFKRDNGLEFKPQQVIISNGAKQSIANAILCTVNPGDEVIIPTPYWVSYPEIVKLAGGIIKEIPTTIESDFKVTPEQIRGQITGKTKIFIFSSPCNPTGSVYTYKELKALASVFEEHPQILIISDEIYEYINFVGKHESMGQFNSIKDQVIVVNGVSKGFAMTGWRIGYLAAPQYIAKACDTLQGQYTSGASSIAQKAALKAVQTDPCASEEIKNMINTFKERRDLVLKLLEGIPDIKTNEPQGAFYIFPNISSYFGKSFNGTQIENSTDLCLYILDQAKVALVPGSAFGNPDCVRVSYATSDQLLIEAVKRVKEALDHLS